MSSLARDSGESGAPGEGGSLAEIATRVRFGARRLGGLVNTGPLSFGTSKCDGPGGALSGSGKSTNTGPV
jgi:hypothetical protein